MPESPEVTYLAMSLTRDFASRTLNQIEILGGRYKRHSAPSGFREFVKHLPIRLVTVNKKGKVLFFEFDNGWTMISRLGLTGWWYKNDKIPDWKQNAHIGLAFHFGRNRMLYDDQLSYGTIAFLKHEDADKVRDELAPDVMDARWSDVRERIKKLRGQKRIEDVITDQKAVVSGIGNYLKSEVLYNAKIPPMREVPTLKNDEWKRILRVARTTSLRMFKVLTHESTDDEYDKNMRVYKKKADPNGNKVVTYTSTNGRMTYWVPEVQQKKPR